MINIKITVKNDQKKLTEEFDRNVLILDASNDELQAMCRKVIKDFTDDPSQVEEVVVKAKMIL